MQSMVPPNHPPSLTASSNSGFHRRSSEKWALKAASKSIVEAKRERERVCAGVPYLQGKTKYTQLKQVDCSLYRRRDFSDGRSTLSRSVIKKVGNPWRRVRAKIFGAEGGRELKVTILIEMKGRIRERER